VKYTILIVEDDPDVEFMLNLAVEWLLGAEATARQSVAGLFDEIQTTKPDLVLLDTSVPESISFLQKLKADQATHSIPVIGINSRGFMTCAEAIREGFDDCFDAGDIEKIVARAREILDSSASSG